MLGLKFAILFYFIFSICPPCFGSLLSFSLSPYRLNIFFKFYFDLSIIFFFFFYSIFLFRSFSVCFAAAAAKSLQSCSTPCDPIDGSPPGSPVPGILLARTLEWIAISFSNAQSEKWKWKWSCAWLSATPWTAAHHAPWYNITHT